LGKWEEYLDFLDENEYSVKVLTGNLIPAKAPDSVEKIRIDKLSYDLWSFQQKILNEMGRSTLILGLPTGLGKTFLAGAYLKRESAGKEIRVLFLVPTVPLGVQQTVFARRMLNLDGACMVTGAIGPEKRRALKVWNNPYVVTTPQTFANDFLKLYSTLLKEVRESENPIPLLTEAFAAFQFPFDVVVADECQGYIGETDGYSILLAASASGSKIVALSATPQLHAPERLKELKKIFDKIHVFSSCL